MVLQEVNVTEQEKQQAIENLQIQVNGAVSYLLLLRQTATQQNALHLYPVFENITVQSMLERYEKLQQVRGY